MHLFLHFLQLVVFVHYAFADETLPANDQTCEVDSQGDCVDVPDEVGLLQGQLRAKPIEQGYERVKSSEGCSHNGHMHGSGVCFCNPGFSGPHCENDEEITDEPNDGYGLAEGDYDTLNCNKTFTVYPYISPENWATAHVGWEACAGKRQSPIDIRRHWCWWNKHERGDAMRTTYGEAAEEPLLTNNGHSIEVLGHFGNVFIDDDAFKSVRFHFHHPSEHTIDGAVAPLEMHIVNMQIGGNNAVAVGILFDVGPRNKCLDDVFQFLQAGCVKRIKNIDIGKCFKKQLAGPWWSYDGSLTTPACAEVVTHNVMQVRATISWDQLQMFKKLYPMNARPVQPLNGRKVTIHKVK